MKHRYRIFDLHLGYWLPGDYNSVEVCGIIGFRVNCSKYASGGYTLANRYRLAFADKEELIEPRKMISQKILEEWDRVRLEILKRCGK